MSAQQPPPRDPHLAEVAQWHPIEGTPEKKKVAIGCSIGATIETYDFIGFGTAAALYFNHVFFPATDPLSGTLLSFATLGIGFAVRPLGGIIGGYLGDRIGRKPVLVGSLLLMGIATVLIGVLPTYQQVGVWAGILLVAVRVVQGLAFGAEWGGAILMCFEHAPWRKKGLYTGITQAGFPVGLLLANFAFLVSVPLGDQWAWRVPFLLSAVLIVVGILIRLKIEESPEFEELKEEGEISKNPLLEVLRDDWRNMRARVLPAHRRDRGLRRVGHLHPVLPVEPEAGRPRDHPDRADDRRRARHRRHHPVGRADRPHRPPPGLPARHRAHRRRGVCRCSSWSTPAPRSRSSSRSSSATPSARTPSPVCRAPGSPSCSPPRPAPPAPRWPTSSPPSSPASPRWSPPRCSRASAGSARPCCSPPTACSA